jgi:hypothetical protein
MGCAVRVLGRVALLSVRRPNDWITAEFTGELFTTLVCFQEFLLRSLITGLAPADFKCEYAVLQFPQPFLNRTHRSGPLVDVAGLGQDATECPTQRRKPPSLEQNSFLIFPLIRVSERYVGVSAASIRISGECVFSVVMFDSLTLHVVYSFLRIVHVSS